MRWENISIHAPTRGATIVSVELCDFLLFQSTLPREERHKAQNYLKRYYIISIHAPTRGATLRLINPLPVLCISIHAPTRGATERCTYWMPWGSFQSTLPREERLSVDFIKHAKISHFNPRSHERSDWKWYIFFVKIFYFNPRSHERSD